MCMVYMTQALDKGALGPVSIMGWLEDVNAQGQGRLIRQLTFQRIPR